MTRNITIRKTSSEVWKKYAVKHFKICLVRGVIVSFHPQLHTSHTTNAITMMLITKLIFTAFSAAISTVKASQSSLLRTARSLQAPENCDTCYNQTSGAGNTYEFYPQWLNGSRDYVYCEMIWNYNDTYGSDLFSTSPIKVRRGKRC